MNKYLLLILVIGVYLAYLPLNQRKSKYYWHSKLDNFIPYISFFILPYLSFIPYLVFSIIITWNTAIITPLLQILFFAKLFTIAFWYVFPNGVRREKRVENTILDKITNRIYKIDGDTNAFPSSHIFTTLIITYYLSTYFHKYSLIFIVIGILISASTVFVKQHYVVDILGGILVFLASIYLLA